MEKLKEALDLIKAGIVDLEIEGEKFYAEGDNKRGNIRADAANRLKNDLERLTQAYDYMIIAITK